MDFPVEGARSYWRRPRRSASRRRPLAHRLQFTDHSLGQRQPDRPEFRVARVKPEGRKQFGVRLRAAGRQKREIALDETFVRPLVDAIEGIYETIAESVGVDIE